MFYIIYNFAKVALGCFLVLLSLHIVPPRIYIFDSFSNFIKEVFAIATLFAGIWLIGFFNKSKKAIMIKRASKMKTHSLCLFIIFVFYGILFPHYNHLELIFSEVNSSINYFISFCILTVSMILIGAAEVEPQEQINLT